MRFEHWERRLAAVIAGAARLPFDWGRLDCALFAADGVWALTQKDPAADWRGTYADAAGAARIIAAAGGLAALIEQGLARIGWPVERINVNYGQRGDPVLYLDAGRETCGLIEGKEIVAKSETGLVRVPRAAAQICWAIR